MLIQINHVYNQKKMRAKFIPNSSSEFQHVPCFRHTVKMSLHHPRNRIRRRCAHFDNCNVPVKRRRVAPTPASSTTSGAYCSRPATWLSGVSVSQSSVRLGLRVRVALEVLRPSDAVVYSTDVLMFWEHIATKCDSSRCSHAPLPPNNPDYICQAQRSTSEMRWFSQSVWG